MQAARIWFKQTEPAFKLPLARKLFEQAGVVVVKTEWRLEEFVVPQLLVKIASPFLIQFDDFESVAEEARESAKWLGDELPQSALNKLAECNARFDIGGPEGDDTIATEEGTFVFAGFETVDPSEPHTSGLLRLLTRAVNGVFEDNINGVYWFP